MTALRRRLATAGMALAFAGLASGCGWHLRGQASAAPALRAITLKATDTYTPLYRTFRNEYARRRIDVDAVDAEVQLTLLQETTGAHIKSLDSALHPAENELSLKVRYEIATHHGASRAFELQLYRTTEPGSKPPGAVDNENARLLDDMRREASERILNQLVTLAAPAPDSTVPEATP